MQHAELFSTPGLAIALALAAGIIAQSVARHIQIPGIVILIATGVVLGPDVTGVVRPEALGPGLFILVGFAVAVILFEGGMNLNVGRLRRAQRPIRRLVLWGGLVSAVGGTLAAWWLLGWELRMAVLFGTLIVVTGPTVVNPLMRRLKVSHRATTVLEAEGVLVDPIGAVLAVVALEIAISPTGVNVAKGAGFLFTRLAFGAVVGLVGGYALSQLLRIRNLVPDGLENVLTLSLVLTMYQGSNAIFPESGIAAVTVAGLVVGNLRTMVHRDLLEFKEQLTVLLIGMLFVLLAADVRMEDVQALGWPGVAVVAAVLFVIRPLCVAVGTWGTDLNWRERVFMGWIGPRGIVAAAIASLFASELKRLGMPGGPELRALIFLVIAVTVLSAGLGGGVLARVLGLRRPSDAGWVILGANDLARAMALSLRGPESPVVCIDTNPNASRAAEEAGLRVIHGNGLEERALQRAVIDTRAGALGMTANEEVNLLFVQKVRQEARQVRTYIAARGHDMGASRRLAEEEGAEVLFGRPIDFELWGTRLRHGQAQLTRWRLTEDLTDSDRERVLHPNPDDLFLALAVHRGSTTRPMRESLRPQADDELWAVADSRKLDEVARVFGTLGIERLEDPEPIVREAAAKGESAEGGEAAAAAKGGP